MAATRDDSFNLKHRLVGGTVLILTAVILLPRVLTESNRDIAGHSRSVGREVSPQIQSEIATAIQPAVFDLSDTSTGTRIEILDEVDAITSQSEASPSVNEANKEKLTTSSVGSSTLLPSQASFDTVVGGFVAQVGVFKKKQNLDKLLAQLKRDGISVKTELIQVSGVPATRVWLGPFGTRSDALREGNKAMMRTNTKPMIVKWP